MPASTTPEMTPPSPTAAATQSVSLVEIISALSYALDLTEDAVPGHAIRSCLLGMRIAGEMQLTSSDRESLFYSLLLKDVGCSNNASRMYQIIGGDDRSIKTGVKLEDWTRPYSPSASAVQLLWRSVLPGARTDKRIVRMIQIAFTQHRNNRELIALRCDRGAEIARKLGLSDTTAEAIRGLDEHWDGHGYPDHRKQQDVPLLSRIIAVAQHLDVFSTERSPEAAVSVLESRSRRWFDPEIVRVVLSLQKQGILWQGCLASRSLMKMDPHARAEEDQAALHSVLAYAPDPDRQLAASEIDNICAAFADVVDAKSPFTYRHSLSVAEVAERMAITLGFQNDRLHLIRRAALLHDIGKLRVPNSILDKPGPLTAEERAIMEEHSFLTRQILGRVAAFGELAKVAGAHHERLDGSGYPDRLKSGDLSLEARLIAVADVFAALTEDRPYREPMNIDKVIQMMQQDVPRKLDARCFEALIVCVADLAGPAGGQIPDRSPTWGSTAEHTRSAPPA